MEKAKRVIQKHINPGDGYTLEYDNGDNLTFNKDGQLIDHETGEVIAIDNDENSAAVSVDSVDPGYQFEAEAITETKFDVPDKAVNQELVERANKSDVNGSGEVVAVNNFDTEICNYARYHNLLNSLMVNKNYSIDKKTSKKKVKFPSIELKFEESSTGLVLPFEQQKALHAVQVLLSNYKKYNDEITRSGTIMTTTGIILPSIKFRYKTFYKAMGLSDNSSYDARKKARDALYDLSRVEPPTAKLTIKTPDGEIRSIQVGGKTQNVLFVLDKKLVKNHSDYRPKDGYRIELKPYLFSKVAVEFSQKIINSQDEDSTIPLPENINEYHYNHPDYGYLHTDCFHLIGKTQATNRKYLMALLNYLKYRCHLNARRSCSSTEKLNIQPIKFETLGKDYLGLEHLIAESHHSKLKNRILKYSEQLKKMGIVRSFIVSSDNKKISFILNKSAFHPTVNSS
jgi:hypothetical protein